MEPIDWYDKGHDLASGYFDEKQLWRWNVESGTYVWDLPPGAADAALEELRKARIKRQDSSHVVLIPRRFTHIWKKQLLKCCDFVVDIAAGQKLWSHGQFEPLTLGICFPFLPFRPWKVRHTPRLFSLEREVSQVFKTYPMDGGSVLRKLCLEEASWHTMQERMVWSMLYYRPINQFPSYDCAESESTRGKRQGSDTTRKGLETGTQKRRRL